MPKILLVPFFSGHGVFTKAFLNMWIVESNSAQSVPYSTTHGSELPGIVHLQGGDLDKYPLKIYRCQENTNSRLHKCDASQFIP